MEINYLLSLAQVKSLLVGMGYQKTVGLKIDGGVVDDRMMVSTLNQLTNEGLLESDGVRFVLQNDIRRIINQIGNVSYFMGIRSKNNQLPDLCAFPGKELLLCEQEKRCCENLRFGFCGKNNLFKRLYEEGYFPEFENSGTVEEDLLESFESEYLDLCSDLDPIPEDSRELLVLFYKNSDNCKYYYRVINYFMYRYLLFFDGEKKFRYLFTRENAEMVLSKFLEGFK